ncbi:hypothetical protein H2200_013537 [Cladophialophora chaetospira]|uniref:Uncharacterized protein n=1 Tax=Cladophialophora chaetospira TaxID=386627 RepID=A0AA38UE67_9EURO|nr:hypothetical protein H2200_013537 [Cladophialophora chaetospira]
MSLWVESCNEWRKQLPEDVEKALQKHEKDKTYDDPEYKEAVQAFYKKHVTRIWPFPQDLLDTIKQVEEDDTVYFTMNGPSEFCVIGSLRTWSVVDEVHKIKVPCLVINAEWDEGRDRQVFRGPYTPLKSALC